MKDSLLVLDGSRGAAASVGYHREGTYMGDNLGRTVELVDSITEAEGALEESQNRPFGAVLTEPWMYFFRKGDLPEYWDFLKSLRTERGIPVVIYSSQKEDVVNREFGLEKGVHYNVYTPKGIAAEGESGAELMVKTIEQLLPS